VTGNLLFFDVVNRDYLGLVEQTAGLGYTIVFNGGPLAALARETGLDVLTWDGVGTPEIHRRARRDAERIARSVAEAAATPIGRRPFESDRGDFLPHSGPVFLQSLREIAFQQIVAVEMFESLRRQAELDAVVLGCDNSPVQRAIVLYARRRRIPTVQLAHAIYGHSLALARPAGEMHTLYSDYLAVFGRRAKQDAVDAGTAPERIVETGAPHWDRLVRIEAKIDRDEACRSLGLDPARPVVLYCAGYADGSTAFYSAFVRWFDDVFRAVAKACSAAGEGVQLVVRPHPHERARQPTTDREYAALLDRLKAWSCELGTPIAQFSLGDKTTAVGAADVVVAPASSSIVPEVMILQRPVVGVPFFNEAGLLYDESDGVAVARDEDQIANEIRRLTADRAYRDKMLERQRLALPDLNATMDGTGSLRTARFIHEIAGRGRLARRRQAKLERRPGRLRILLAAHDFPPFGNAGTEKYTKDLADALVQRGHDVRILHPRPVHADPSQCAIEEDEVDGLPVARLLIPTVFHSSPRLDFIKPALERYLREKPVDVVHAQHLMGLGVSFIESVHRLGLPLVFTANDFWPLCDQIHLMHPSGGVCTGPDAVEKCVQCARDRIGFPEDRIPAVTRALADRHATIRRSLPMVDLMICPSRFLMDVFQRHGFVGRRTIHLPQGARRSTTSIAAERVSSRARRPLALAYLGHIARRKGLDILIKAFNALPEGCATLDVYGADAEPDYLRECLALASAERRPTYHGPYDRSDMPKILADVDLAVVPSRGENYPFVIREILQLGVPVVASDVAGVPEIIEDGVNGRLFRCGDAAELARVLREIADNPESIARLRGGIRPQKTIESDAEELESHYRSLLRERLSASGHQGASRVNVVLVAPNDSFPTLAHAELGRMLVAGFHELGISARMQRNRVQADAVNLFIGFEWIENFDRLPAATHVALHMEPSTDPGLIEKLRRADEVWSLDPTVVRELAARGLRAKLLPFGSADLPADPAPVRKDVDVLFEGVPNARQKWLIDSVRKFCEATCFAGAFGATRDALYDRARIILHVRPAETAAAPLARILYQIHRGAFVLAEGPLEAEAKDYVESAPYDRLASEVRRWLARPDERAARAAAARARLRERPISASLLQLFDEPNRGSRRVGKDVCVLDPASDFY
jgi:glycosyltransferase involved in cell wall biosynthesis